MASDSSLTPLSHPALRALRQALMHDLGDQFAGVLQQTGSAGGAELMTAFDGWCSRKGLGHPEALAMSRFRSALTDFLRDAGWGTVRFVELGTAVLALEATDWAEAEEAPRLAYPSCFYSAGLLADLFGRVADGPMACLEVSCRASDAPTCRFLVGSPEVLTAVHQRIVEGMDPETAVRGVAAPPGDR